MWRLRRKCWIDTSIGALSLRGINQLRCLSVFLLFKLSTFPDNFYQNSKTGFKLLFRSITSNIAASFHCSFVAGDWNVWATFIAKFNKQQEFKRWAICLIASMMTKESQFSIISPLPEILLFGIFKQLDQHNWERLIWPSSIDWRLLDSIRYQEVKCLPVSCSFFEDWKLFLGWRGLLVPVLLLAMFIQDLLTKAYSISCRSLTAVCISPAVVEAFNPRDFTPIETEKWWTNLPTSLEFLIAWDDISQFKKWKFQIC